MIAQPAAPAVAEPDSPAEDAAAGASDQRASDPVGPETVPVPTWPRPRPVPGRAKSGPAWLGSPPGSTPAPGPAAPSPPDEADEAEKSPPPAAVGPAAAIQSNQATQPSSAVVSALPALGDPVFTARTPEPGSREREQVLPGGVQVPEQRGSGYLRAGPARPDELDDLQSKRVRVVLAERKGVARPVRTVVDIQEGTGVGEFLRNDLIKTQLGIALWFAVGAGLTLGLLPLLFAMVPEIGRIEVLGVRLPWLLLGLLVYPFLFGLGLWHSRLAERVEQSFADHVQD